MGVQTLQIKNKISTRILGGKVLPKKARDFYDTIFIKIHTGIIKITGSLFRYTNNTSNKRHEQEPLYEREKNETKYIAFPQHGTGKGNPHKFLTI